MSSTVSAQWLGIAALLYPLCAWLLMAVLAVLNGGFREVVLIPRIGNYPGHVLSTAILVLAILGVSFLFFRTIPVEYSQIQLLLVGAAWVVMTVGFEFLVGYAEGTPVSVTLGQYNVLAGQVWIAVPITLLVAPLLFGWYLAS
ncbi:MAG: hypothetical protein ABEJ84_03780 [Halodesulfurarchaeum sp.]